MKKRFLLSYLPALCALLGLGASSLRRTLYAVAVDGTGRLAAGHPLSIALGALTAGVLVLVAASVYFQKETQEFEGNFPAGLLPMAGCAALALGLALTVLRMPPMMPGLLGQLWTLLGLAAIPCLLASGISQLLGRKPFFLLPMVPAVFFTAHLINHYQLWCSNPQIQDVIFPLFATVALTVTAYQQGAFSVGMGSRRQLLAAGCLAVYLCLAECAVTGYPWLYLTGAIWAGTTLCRWEVAS